VKETAFKYKVQYNNEGFAAFENDFVACLTQLAILQDAAFAELPPWHQL